ncbi:MAG: cytoplasmic protein [Elusimicrobiota bacterium]|nr:cytoplasmic protein [Elusimicrobiota bacterium]
MGQYLIVLHAGKGSPDGLARVFHALLYCKDFLERGVGAKLVFDGAGVEWVPELMQPEHKLHPLFKEIQAKGSIDAVCDHCSGVVGAKDLARKAGVPVHGDFHGHPSIAKYAAEGYRIIVI